MSSTSEHFTIRQEAPCGCIIEMSGDEAAGATISTPSKCPCATCGKHCRCAEVKGHCDCAERIEAATKEHRPTMITATAPLGCVLELGAEDICETCGRKGCRCIAVKGSCHCPVVREK